jgi:hypothetical protein
MCVESTQGEQFNPETPVYGIFECWKCNARRPIFVPRVEYWRKGGGGARTFHCRVCNAKSSVKWLDERITFQAYLDQQTEEAPK